MKYAVLAFAAAISVFSYANLALSMPTDINAFSKMLNALKREKQFVDVVESSAQRTIDNLEIEATEICGPEDVLTVKEQLAEINDEPIDMPVLGKFWPRFKSCMPKLIEYCSVVKQHGDAAGIIEFKIHILDRRVVDVLAEMDVMSCDVLLHLERPMKAAVDWSDEVEKWRRIAEKFQIVSLSVPWLKESSESEFDKVMRIIEKMAALEELEVGELNEKRKERLLNVCATELLGIASVKIGADTVDMGMYLRGR